MIHESIVGIAYHVQHGYPTYLSDDSPPAELVDTVLWLQRPSKQLRAAVEQAMIPGCKEYLCIPTEPEPEFPEMRHRFSVRSTESKELLSFYEDRVIDSFDLGQYSEIYYHCRPTKELRARAKELGLREYYCIQPLDIED